MQNKHAINEEAPLLRLAVCLMLGIVAGDSFVISVNVALAILATLVGLALLLWRWPRLQSASIALCFVGLGWLLVQRQHTELTVNWPPTYVTYEAVVISEPVEKPRSIAVDLLLASDGRKLKAYLAKDERSRNLKPGDGLQATSRIQIVGEWHRGSFDYRRYLQVHGFTGQTYVPSGRWRKCQVSLEQLSRWERARIFFLEKRHQLLSRISIGKTRDEAYGVVAAMVLGDKSALTHELREVYSQTGASHVLALSGLHLGIIFMLLSLLVPRHRWRVASQVLVLLAVWAFVLLVGFSVSVVRAAVMVTIYALLSLTRRNKMSVNVLAFTAMVMLCFSPYALFDVGFQLSFAAVGAILLFYPFFLHVFTLKYLQEHPVLKWVWGMIGVSMAAQIGTAPLVVYYFGRFATYFLLTNFIVIPAAYLILHLALMVMLFPGLASVLFRVADLLNSILTEVAQLPGASIEGLHPTIIQTAMMYVIIAAVYLILRRLGLHIPKPA
ncbi:MAG: ComEC family competence protein [Prevotella sp.]|nr:ComEC family competence protein [Prevotella sp.]